MDTSTIPEQFPMPYLSWSALEDLFTSFSTVQFGYGIPLSPEAPPLADVFSPEPRFGGQLKQFIEHLVQQRVANETSIVVSRQASRLAELWAETDRAVEVNESLESRPEPGELIFLHGAISEGWRLDPPQESSLHFLTDAEIFGWSQPRPRRRPLPVSTGRAPRPDPSSRDRSARRRCRRSAGQPPVRS